MSYEMLSDVLSLSQLNPLLSTRMHLGKFPQIINFVLHYPQALMIVPKFTVPLRFLFGPNLRTGVDSPGGKGLLIPLRPTNTTHI